MDCRCVTAVLGPKRTRLYPRLLNRDLSPVQRGRGPQPRAVPAYDEHGSALKVCERSELSLDFDQARRYAYRHCLVCRGLKQPRIPCPTPEDLAFVLKRKRRNVQHLLRRRKNSRRI